MGKVTIAVNGTDYELSCEDGEEEHVRALGRQVERRVLQLVAQLGQIGEGRLLMMACLLTADELREARTAREALAGEIAAREADLAADLDALTARIETVVAQLSSE